MCSLFITLMLIALSAAPTLAAMVQGMPDNAKVQFASGGFKPADTYKARLYVTANTTMSIASTTACSSTGELSGGNYAPVTLTGAAITSDTANHYAMMSFTSPVTWGPNFTAAHVDGMAICDYTAPNDTTNGTLVAYYTFTDTPTTNGTLTITLPAVAYNSALITWH